MKLADAAAGYVAHKQSMGMRFRTEARTLKSFCRAVGDITMAEVDADRVAAFLAGTGPITRFWERKHSVLQGFYRFAMARHYVDRTPLSRKAPKPRQVFEPYIYSREELRRLLDATIANDHPRSHISPETYRVLVLLLYGAGLRISEALGLTAADVDLAAGILVIRESKFYKTRLVPIGADLGRVLIQHAARHGSGNDESPFFRSRRGNAITRQTAENTFCRLRAKASVERDDGNPRHQPRLHDLRHSMAVHRLVSWYRDGVDVQRLLPQLATYLGHLNIAGTQRYLTLTPEVLREASVRFERYALEPSQ
jgi:site-specific recombinase XerD